MADDDVVGTAMLSLEQSWLQKTLGDALEKTKKIFASFGQELVNDGSRNGKRTKGGGSIQFDNIQGLLKALGERGAKVFQSLFSEQEWKEIEASQAAIVEADITHVRAVRIRRRRQFLAATRSVVIDIVDDTIAEELKGLMQEVSGQLAAMGQRRQVEEEQERELQEEQEEERDNDRHDGGSGDQSGDQRSTGHSDDSNGERDGEPSDGSSSDQSAEDDEPVERSADLGQRSVSQRSVSQRSVSQRSLRQKRVVNKKREDPPPRQLPNKKAKKGKPEQVEVVGRKGIIGNGDQDEDVEDRPTPAEMLKRMKASVAVVESIMRLSGKEVGVGALMVPDPNTSGEEWGEVLLKDGQLLAAVLAEGDSRTTTPVERVAKLQQVFDLYKRAFAIASLLTTLRPKKQGKNVTTLEQRYAALKAKLEREGNRCCAYRQAARYDALATFLKSYPRAMLQIEICTLRAWTYWLGKDRLPSAMSEEDKVFWAALPKKGAGADDDEPQDVCLVCTGDELVGELWFCSECTCWFHDTCCGYEKGSLCKEVAFPGGEAKELDAYCSKCLAELGMTHVDVMENVKETRSIGLFLNDEECTFDLEPVLGDGYCIFNCLEGFAKEQLGFSGTSNKFCGELAKAALQSLENIRSGEWGEESVEPSVVEALRTLIDMRGRVAWLKSGEWQGVEVQHLVLGYLRMFPQAQVIIYGASNKGWVVSQDQGYGSGGKILYLLQWRTTEHYDRLKLKRR